MLPTSGGGGSTSKRVALQLGMVSGGLEPERQVPPASEQRFSWVGRKLESGRKIAVLS